MTQRILVTATAVGLVVVIVALARSASEDSSSPASASEVAAVATTIPVSLSTGDPSASPALAREVPVVPVLEAEAEPVASAPAAPVASTPGPDSGPPVPAPPAREPARPPRPGSSLLYAGAAFLARVPAALPRTEDRDAEARKAAQLERSADVADKRGTIVGAIERVDAKELSGWAYAWDDPEVPATVEVFVDGTLVATLAAREARGAFASLDPGNPIEARGWRCASPPVLGDGDKHWVSALGSKPGSDAKRALRGSPWEFGGVHWPRGGIVHASARLVYGWAVDPDEPRSPVSVEVLADGKPLARLATRGPGQNAAVRAEAVAAPGAPADLGPVGEDAQAFAFVPPEPIGASFLQVRIARADGSLAREAEGSPRKIAETENRLPFGSVTFVNDAQVSGWAVDPDVSPGSISVDVVVDGVPAGRIPADRNFAALPNFTTIKEPTHAFTFVPPDRYRDGKAHSVQFFAVNQPEGPNPELQGSPTTFVGKRNATPYGWLDGAGPGGANGWAYDPDAGSAPVQVEVWLDDVLVSAVTANGDRPDLVPIVAAEPTHGFSCALPAAISDGKHHVVRAFAVNFPDGPKQELAGSPRELNAQSPWFGVSLKDSATLGLVIDSVVAGSPAQAAGVLAGDVVRSFDGTARTVDTAAFVAWFKTKEVGEKVVFKLWHDPAQGAPADAAPPDPDAPPLGSGERLVVVTVGAR